MSATGWRSNTSFMSPWPVTIFTNWNASLGNQSSKFEHGRRVPRLSIIVLPAASAGPILTALKNSWEFHGTIAAITPSGSLSVRKHIWLVDWQRFTGNLVGGTGIEMQIFSNVFCLPPRFFQHLTRIGGFTSPSVWEWTSKSPICADNGPAQWRSSCPMDRCKERHVPP